MMGDWKYPILWANENGGLMVVRNDQKMFLTTTKRIPPTGMADSLIVDCDLSCWRVEGARFLHWRPWLSDWPEYAFTRTGTMELDTQYQGVWAFSAVTNLICSTLNKNVEFWESGGSIEELTAEVAGAKTFAELVNIFDSSVAPRFL